ncbi:two-component system CitB family sensor kinase [Nocardia sp. GP40]
MYVFGRGVRMRTQIVLLQVLLVALALGIAFGVFAYVSEQRVSEEYGQRALAIARTVAADPEVREDVARYSLANLPTGSESDQELAKGRLQTLAEDARARNDALYVVLTDSHGIRLAHPQLDRLGEMVSTDPSAALHGAEVVIRQRGTLGESVRAKVPVRQPNSTGVVGEVSVGISTAAVHDQLLRDLRRAGLLAGFALLAGVLGALALARRWHGLTLGLQPPELAELVREQAAVLHGIGEGVVAVDTRWRATVVNDEARRLLGIEGAAGTSLDELGLTPRITEVFRAATARPVAAAVGDRLLVVTARTVSREGRELGAVLSVRDRTDVESLTRQLDAVQSMSTVLRAQRHEFANRLHLLSGLLHGGRAEEASQYIDELLGSGPLGAALPGMDTLRDPYLQAFLAAKAAHARESGVELRLGPNTWVDANLVVPVDVTTVLGNLLDNAIEAARTGAGTSVHADPPDAAGNDGPSAAVAAQDTGRRPGGRELRDAATATVDQGLPLVEVELVQEGSTLHIAVADSGAGVAAELAESIFAEGVSTRPDGGAPGGRGVGLALSRQVARALGGDVVLANRGGGESDLPGAEFIARLPGVLVEGTT